MIKIIDKEDLNFDYSKYDFKDNVKYVYETPEGLNEEIIREISEIKGEPDWMLEFRLKAFRIFKKLPMPKWGPDLSRINFEKIRYYLRPTERSERTWEEVPEEIKETFDKLGIPEAERKFLAGVGAQYDSELVYHSLAKELEQQGVIFLGTDQALQEYPEIFKKYFATVVPPGDNKFTALNSAVWSGGSFVYIPKSTKVDFPLQAYFRINAQRAGQFERTLIIVEEGSDAHYIEGCFLEGAMVRTREGEKPIEFVEKGDEVLTHNGRFERVYNTLRRKYNGQIFSIKHEGDSTKKLVVTEEHPLLILPAERINDKENNLKPMWKQATDIKETDYLAIPVPNRNLEKLPPKELIITANGGEIKKKITIDNDFFRLIGYYLSASSIFDSNVKNRENALIDSNTLLERYFGDNKYFSSINRNNTELIINKIPAFTKSLSSLFGDSIYGLKIPDWVINASDKQLIELIKGMWNSNGSFDKERGLFTFRHVNLKVIYLFRDALLRLGIASKINYDDGHYIIIICRPWNQKFGEIIGVEAKAINCDGDVLFKLTKYFLFVPISSIIVENGETVVYNLSVENDETYVCEGVVSHNCTAPIYSTNSLHAAVVEVIAKKRAHLRYTTIQNWSTNVFNLVTKRAHAYEEAFVEWIDGNIGSGITMKYPAIYLLGEKAKAEVISIAYAGAGQHQDTGAKAIHMAPNTSSRIINKSVSNNGGITTYRGLVHVAPGSVGAKVNVQCDALILDNESKTDTYPYIEVQEDDVTITHEATVGKISEDILFYAMTRGIPEAEALNMVVMGFLEPFTKELPLEYAVELNKLIKLEMEGSVG